MMGRKNSLTEADVTSNFQRELEEVMSQCGQLTSEDAYPRPEMHTLGTSARRLADRIALTLPGSGETDGRRILQWRVADNIAVQARDWLRTGGRNAAAMKLDLAEVRERLNADSPPQREDVVLVNRLSADLHAMHADSLREIQSESVIAFAFVSVVIALVGLATTGHLGTDSGDWKLPATVTALLTGTLSLRAGHWLVPRFMAGREPSLKRTVEDSPPVAVCRGYHEYWSSIEPLILQFHVTHEKIVGPPAESFDDWLAERRGAIEVAEHLSQRFSAIRPPRACDTIHSEQIQFIDHWERLLSISLYVSPSQSDLDEFNYLADYLNESLNQITEFCQ